MFQDMFNTKGINWWTLLGGLGLNFVLSLMVALGGSYLAQHAEFGAAYEAYGQPIIMLVIFVLCGLSGFTIAKIADNVPLKHALWASMGAFVPMVGAFVLGPNIFLLMMAIVAVAGNLNGAMLAAPKRRSYGPPNDRR
ncbi:MAG: hypothetical protein ACOX3S_12250 [Anaerolineae bacterium]|jgi:hypothetical protein